MPARRVTTRTEAKPKRSTKTLSKRPVATKLDLYAKHRNEYVAGRLPALVRVGPAKYVTISGCGTPGSEDFTRAIGALYNVAFTIKMARKFAQLAGRAFDGKHHEIYLSDPRRVKPEKLRTILRQPVS